MEIKIREVNGEWAVDIEMPDRMQVIYFASRQNALQVMHYLQLVDNIIKLDEKKLQTPMTNYDRIKAMNIDEMAEHFDGIFDCSNCPNDMFLCESKGSVCTKYIKQWLQQEVSE